MKKLIFATHNVKKLIEAQSLISSSIELLSLSDVDFNDDIEEYETTFHGNATIKAKAVFEATGIPCFADDSGLVVPALNGDPGVKSARYANDNGIVDHHANNRKLLTALGDATERGAYFITVICLMLAPDAVYYFEGKVHGNIGFESKGDQGFGYDPIFIPEGYQKTFAELGLSIKNQISHRALALQAMQNFLTTF